MDHTYVHVCERVYKVPFQLVNIHGKTSGDYVCIHNNYTQLCVHGKYIKRPSWLIGIRILSKVMYYVHISYCYTEGFLIFANKLM